MIKRVLFARLGVGRPPERDLLVGEAVGDAQAEVREHLVVVCSGEGVDGATCARARARPNAQRLGVGAADRRHKLVKGLRKGLAVGAL